MTLLADLLVVLHLGFVAFVVGGGFLVARRPWLAALHLPAAAWGAYIEFSGGICPLTPLENRLRRLGGGEAYEGDFVEQYLLPVLYPAELTASLQHGLGAAVVAVNLAAYAWAGRRRVRSLHDVGRSRS